MASSVESRHRHVALRLDARHCCAGLQQRELGFVAVHGTGTPLGDPIEMGALGQAASLLAHDSPPLAIGSVKSCYGHTEGCAGLTGALFAAQSLLHLVRGSHASMPGHPNCASGSDTHSTAQQCHCHMCFDTMHAYSWQQ